MSRRPYVHLAGDLSTWPKGFVPVPATMRKLDQFSSEMVNGDAGGTYAPTSPIVLGPHGSPTISLTTAGSVLSGDVETVLGNRLDTVLTATPGLILTGGAVPDLQAAVTRTVVVPFTTFLTYDTAAQFTFLPTGVLDGNDTAWYVTDPLTLGATGTPALDSYNVCEFIMLTVPFSVRAQHRNATIDSVDVRFIVNGRVTIVPPTPLTIRVVRVRANTQVALHTAAGGYDAQGWLADTAGTVSAFTNNGEPRTLSYVPDQNNTALDPTQDYYMVQMLGPSKPWIGSVWLNAVVHLSAIADMRQE